MCARNFSSFSDSVLHHSGCLAYSYNFQPSFPWEQLLRALPLKEYPVHKEGKCPEEDKKKHLIVLNWSTNLPPTLVDPYLFPLIFLPNSDFNQLSLEVNT